MPVRLLDFLSAERHGGDSIAGYLEPDARSSGGPHRFVHWESSNPMLPAFVNCLEGGGDMRRIYTNHEDAPWVRPRGPGVKRRGVLRADDGDGSLMIEPVPMTTRAWPASVAGSRGPGPLPAGGLHAATLSSGSATDAPDDECDVSEPARILRHYALAARTLIASSAASGFAGSHDHVGAILVDDTGRILAAGINTGSYRHAEVSLLLSWFRNDPRARTLPAKSIVFCTLTPCRQCTRYLSLAKAPDTLIRFDETDAGRSGRAGERIAERIDVRLGTGTDDELGPVPDVPVPRSVSIPAGAKAVREAERRAVRNGDDGDGGPSRIARSREARRVLLEAGERHREVAIGERSAEAAVQVHLANWIRCTVPERIARAADR